MRSFLIVLTLSLFAFGTSCSKKADEKSASTKAEVPVVKGGGEAPDKSVDSAVPEAGPIPDEFLGSAQVDPVCGMKVEVSKDTAHSHVDGSYHFFCRQGCKNSFDRNPDKYLGK